MKRISCGYIFIPYSTFISSSRALSPWGNTPTTLPKQILTPASSACVNVIFLLRMRSGSGPAPFSSSGIDGWHRPQLAWTQPGTLKLCESG
ncbi:hypothetical protein GJJ30_24660 [Larkinella terrae]|uniref:Uncharacterized protein n=1 Tax=Larkinella terrae TaxID=2025311 RepID=A0A7K0ERS9_9BACT|nr:hypothetical protein [Larkinella terrae]